MRKKVLLKDLIAPEPDSPSSLGLEQALPLFDGLLGQGGKVGFGSEETRTEKSDQDHYTPPCESDRTEPRSRPPRRYSPRWWADRLDYPLSTIYKAIQQGHLRALRPQGGSYVIPPQDFRDWFEGGHPQ